MPEIKGDFWRINAGHVLTIISMAAGGFFFLSQMRADLAVLEAKVSALEAMQQQVSALAVAVAEHTIRIQDLEKNRAH